MINQQYNYESMQQMKSILTKSAVSHWGISLIEQYCCMINYYDN